MRGLITDIKDGFLSVFFPTTCGVCQRPVKNFGALYVCESCYEKSLPLSGNLCPVCMKPLNSPHADICRECRQEERLFTRIAASGLYEGALKELIYKVKFYGKKNTAAFLAARMMKNLPEGFFEGFEMIVPVPATRAAVSGRGYNQTLLIAEQLSKLSGIACSGAVRKIRETEQQNKLDRKERLKNLKGAFEAVSGLEGKRIIVVDDVYTTGATMNEMARALKAAGAAEIAGIVAARSI